ncbi:hypothetical protein QTO34_005733 [Cnephaeus nilssonii]|uniref:Uncharacterized protein n=1 Tax=Cnephaeus nilssonii TaxID=3371016 RepID=A0AA40HM94_CNENI|nr:hypothetical protein QTO34_005733 [Eptesicus nilssonii]
MSHVRVPCKPRPGRGIPGLSYCVRFSVRAPQRGSNSLLCPHPSLEDIPGCPFDFVEVFDGPRITSLSLGRFCAPGAVLVISSSNIITVVFQSDSVVTNSGFQAQFDVIPRGEGEPGGSSSSCGGVLSGARGSFSTPRDPASYPADMRCIWEIHVAEGFLVFLTIQRLRHFCGFQGLTPPCPLRLKDTLGCPDFIEVFDGQQRASLSKGRFCAGEVLTFRSSSNVLTLMFRSDAANTSAGFHSLYRALRPDESDDSEESKESDSGRGLAGAALGKAHFGLGSGDITNDNVQCSAAERHLGQCTHWGWAEHNCGHHEDAGVSPIVAGGSRSCGGVLTRLPGSFSSPGYPENYPTDTQCVWEIHVDKNSRIKLMIPSLK